LSISCTLQDSSWVATVAVNSDVAAGHSCFSTSAFIAAVTAWLLSHSTVIAAISCAAVANAAVCVAVEGPGLVQAGAAGLKCSVSVRACCSLQGSAWRGDSRSFKEHLLCRMVLITIVAAVATGLGFAIVTIAEVLSTAGTTARVLDCCAFRVRTYYAATQ